MQIFDRLLKGETSAIKGAGKMVSKQLGFITHFLAARITKLERNFEKTGLEKSMLFFSPSTTEHMECFFFHPIQNRFTKITFKQLVFGWDDTGQIDSIIATLGMESTDQFCDGITRMLNKGLIAANEGENKPVFCHVYNEKGKLAIDLVKGTLSDFEVIRRLDNSELLSNIDLL